MARNKTSFKKGDSRINKKGAPTIPSEIKEIRKLTKTNYIDLLNKYLYKSLPDLDKTYKEKDIAILDKIIIKIFIEALKRGDVARLESMISRIIGKMPDKIDHTTENEKITDVNINIKWPK